MSLQLGPNQATKTRGVPYISLDGGGEKPSYFCAEGLGRLEAQVLCRMLSWPLGKAVELAAGNRNSTLQGGGANTPNIGMDHHLIAGGRATQVCKLSFLLFRIRKHSKTFRSRHQIILLLYSVPMYTYTVLDSFFAFSTRHERLAN